MLARADEHRYFLGAPAVLASGAQCGRRPEGAKAVLLVSLDRVEEGRGSCPVVAPANDCADLKIGVLIQYLRLDEAAGQGLGGQLLAAAARRCQRVAAEVGGVILIIDA